MWSAMGVWRAFYFYLPYTRLPSPLPFLPRPLAPNHSSACRMKKTYYAHGVEVFDGQHAAVCAQQEDTGVSEHTADDDEVIQIRAWHLDIAANEQHTRKSLQSYTITAKARNSCSA